MIKLGIDKMKYFLTGYLIRKNIWHHLFRSFLVLFSMALAEVIQVGVFFIETAAGRECQNIMLREIARESGSVPGRLIPEQIFFLQKGNLTAYALRDQIKKRNFLLQKVIAPDSGMVQKNVQWISYTVWLAIALLIGQVFAMSSNERRREIGILRTMGASRRFIFQLIFLEGFLLGLLGALVGLGLSAGTLLIIFKMMAQSAEGFLMPAFSEMSYWFLISTSLVLLTGIIASLYPALRASCLEPYQALRSGE